MAFLLLNSSNLFIKKYTSDATVMLTYFGYFLGCLELHLTIVRSIKAVFLKNNFANKLFAKGTSDWNSSVGIELSGTSY